VEVERPRRRDRRAGKSDRIEAIAAAKSVLTDERVSTPRRRGILTAIRAVLIARRSAVAERTRVLNQLPALNATAPTRLRERIGAGTGKQLERRLLSMRTRPHADLEERTVFAVMRDLAAHSRALGDDAKRYQQQLAELITTLDNTLLDEAGIGPISAAKLLAGDPSRFKSESAFARCNGTAPIPASSGKTVRYRLNPGGDRQANNAIHTIAIIRAKHQPETRAYLERRISEGKTRREALRSLKRHISRELYHRLAAIPLTS
jgi:transposase